ncbi:MAG: plastocyanin/azurin family copper-binding protein [Halobacteria archaeon]
MRTATLASVAALVAAGLIISGCSAPPSPAATATPPAATTAPPATPTAGAAMAEARVKIVKLSVDPCESWNPCEIRVKAGTTVMFSNDDVAPHDVTFVGGPETPKSGAPGSLVPGQSWSYKFEKAGTYEFHCAIHHPLMHKPGVSPKLIVE